MDFIRQPAEAARLGDRLKDNLAKRQWTSFRAAVAFVKRSGTRHIAPALAEFSRTADVEIIAGIDHGGTSAEGLRDLLNAVSPEGRVIIFRNRLPFTFHPKIYLFKSSSAAELMIGSGNLTEGGLFRNYEAGLHIALDLAAPSDAALLASIEQALDAWADLSADTAFVLDDDFLARLRELGLAPSETSLTTSAEGSPQQDDPDRAKAYADPFAARPVPRAPSVHRQRLSSPSESTKKERSAERVVDPASRPSTNEVRRGFLMILQKTDVGVGQSTKGTSKRSPETFVPLAARNAHPDFWDWPSAFKPDQNKPGKNDRHGVRIRLGGEIVAVNMMTWPDKYDFRLRSATLRSSGNVGDILRMEKADPSSDCDYEAEIIRRGTDRYSIYVVQCRESVLNSKKKYGYYGY